MMVWLWDNDMDVDDGVDVRMIVGVGVRLIVLVWG